MLAMTLAVAGALTFSPKLGAMTERSPLPCPVAPQGKLRRATDGAHDFQIWANDGSFVFRTDQPFQPSCTERELRIAPLPDAKLAPLTFVWKEGAFALATHVGADAREAVKGVSPQRQLEVLSGWRNSVEAITETTTQFTAEWGQVLQLQAEAFETEGRFDLARDTLLTCTTRPESADACRNALPALDARANPGLAVGTVKRLGMMPSAAIVALPIDDGCQPTTFFGAGGLCVVQGKRPPYKSMRCYDVDQNTWGKVQPVAWPSRSLQCNPDGCFACGCRAAASWRGEAECQPDPTPVCSWYDQRHPESFSGGIPVEPVGRRVVAHTAEGITYEGLDGSFWQLTDAYAQLAPLAAVVKAAARSAGGSTLFAGRFNCTPLANAAPYSFALLCVDLQTPTRRFALPVAGVSTLSPGAAWALRAFASPNGKSAALVFIPPESTDASPVLFTVPILLSETREGAAQ